MRKPLILAAFCMLALPLMSSPTQSIELKGRAPFTTVALAGHTLFGGWCECGSTDCLCDPGETPNRLASQGTQNQDERPANEALEQGIDLGGAALLFVLFALTLSRLRG